MKKFIILTLIVLVIVKANAQSTKFIANPVLDKFVGTWVAKKDKKMIILTIKKLEITAINGVTIEMLEGYHSYKEDRNMIDTLTKKPTFTNGSNFSDDAIKYDDRVFFDFHDKSKQKGGHAVFTLSKTNPEELSMILSNVEVFLVRKKSDKPYDMGYTIPIKLVFKKQK